MIGKTKHEFASIAEARFFGYLLGAHESRASRGESILRGGFPQSLEGLRRRVSEDAEFREYVEDLESALAEDPVFRNAVLAVKGSDTAAAGEVAGE